MPIYSLEAKRAQLGERHYVAPGASLIGAVRLDEDASVWFGAVIRADNEPIHIGEGTNIQDGAVLHTDPGFPISIGRMVSIGHKAMLHGCTVEDGALVGIGAVVLNGARIGAGSLIGANALIREGQQVPPGVLVVGSPGRVVRELRPEEKELLLVNARDYVKRAAQYAKALQEGR